MALKPFYAVFDPSPSPDVVGYRFYYVPAGQALDTNSPWLDIGKPEPGIDSRLRVDLSQFAAMAELDGDYHVGITAIDDAGNESAFLEADVQLDFIAPTAPSNLTFQRG